MISFRGEGLGLSLMTFSNWEKLTNFKVHDWTANDLFTCLIDKKRFTKEVNILQNYSATKTLGSYIRSA